MTPPPRKYADAPGTASSVAEISPPADDSATATVCLRSLSSAPSAAPIARSLVGMAPMIARHHHIDRARASAAHVRRAVGSERSARVRRLRLAVYRRAGERDDHRDDG